MTDPAREQAELRCPTCGYDLRGSFVGENRFRCPECGAETDMLSIVVHHEQRRSSRRGFYVGLGTGATVFVVLLVVIPTVGGVRALAQLVPIFVFVTVLVWVLTLPWIGAPQRMRLLFAAGSGLALTLAFVSSSGAVAALAALAALAVFLGGYGWAVRRGFY